MKDMILKFGKHKGQKFQNTPKSYQNWLLKQHWFEAPKQEIPLHHQLNGWDGHSRKGEAIYDAIFEQEKAESDRDYCGCGDMKEASEKYCGWGCIAESGY
jgi:hypothetical protein